MKKKETQEFSSKFNIEINSMVVTLKVFWSWTIWKAENITNKKTVFVTCLVKENLQVCIAFK